MRYVFKHVWQLIDIPVVWSWKYWAKWTAIESILALAWITTEKAIS